MNQQMLKGAPLVLTWQPAQSTSIIALWPHQKSEIAPAICVDHDNHNLHLVVLRSIRDAKQRQIYLLDVAAARRVTVAHR
jgi:hypothetical protein